MNAEKARNWCEVLSKDTPYYHVVTTQGEEDDGSTSNKHCDQSA